LHQLVVLDGASTPQVGQDEVVVLAIGIGPFRVKAPCRVVYLIDEPDRCGFAYGTLPSHPETGEELFLLERLEGRITFTIKAFSRPATRLAQLGGPLSRFVQRAYTAKYLAALDEETG